MARYGIFTDRMRQYLNGELDDLDGGDERSLRAKIRKRTDTAFTEFALLTNVDERDRQKIFEEKLIYTNDDLHVQGGEADPGTLKRAREESEAGGSRGIKIGLGHLMQFVYTGLREQAASREEVLEWLESELAGAIRNGELVLQGSDPYSADALDWHVDVSIDVEKAGDVDLDIARAKLERGEELFPAETKALYESGDLQPAE